MREIYHVNPLPLARNNAHPFKGEGTSIVNKCSSQFDLRKKPNDSPFFDAKRILLAIF